MTPLSQPVEDEVLDAAGVEAKGPARGSAPAAEQDKQEQESLIGAGWASDDPSSRTCVHGSFSSRTAGLTEDEAPVVSVLRGQGLRCHACTAGSMHRRLYYELHRD